MFEQKRKRILEICVVMSLLIHSGFFAFLQNQCLWFLSPSQPVNETASNIEKISADQILKESFEQTVKEAPLEPKNELTPTSFSQSNFPLMEVPSISFSMPSTSFEEMLASHTTLLPIHFTLPTIEYLDLTKGLPRDLILPTPQCPQTHPIFTPQTQVSYSEIAQTAPLMVLDPPEPATLPSKRIAIEINTSISKSLPSIPVPNLPRLPTLAELQTVNLSDSFESELTFLPKSDGSGYIFALTLIPHAELKLPKLRQNIVFLIDRSNSIQRDRLQSTKTAVRRAVEELDGEDRFNIVVFDSKMDKAFPTLIHSSVETRDKASKFIEAINLGSLFTLGDLYKPLFLTIPNMVPEDELYTAILLSDGESLGKKQSQRAFFRDWTLQNSGRVSLYSVGLTGDQHLSTIDAVCAFNNGKLLTATTNKGIKRKLQRLVKNIRNPVAKNIVLKTIPKNSKATVEISSLSPNLFLDQPYVILGCVDSLDDCILFLQGQLKDRYLNVKKTISFVNAKKGGNSLSEEWALNQAYRLYEEYIIDENPKHLADAKTLLEPFNIPSIR